MMFSGSDFTEKSITLDIPAKTTSFEVQQNIVEIFDDNIDEDWQSFVVVAEIGPDVPDGVSCFMINERTTQFHGRQGATEIRITDNDGK